MRIKLSAFFLFLIFLTTGISRANLCDEIIFSLSGGKIDSQIAALNHFSMDGLKWETLSGLSTGVYKIDHKNGFTYVFRIHRPKTNDISFEKFAEEVMEKVPGISFVRTKNLSLAESAKIFDFVKQNEGKGTVDIIPEGSQKKISINVWLPLKSGSDADEAQHFGGNIRDFLIDHALQPEDNHDTGLSIALLNDQIKSANPTDIRSVYEDLKANTVEFREVPFNKFKDKLIEIIASKDRSPFEVLFRITRDKMPKRLKEQLASQYAVRYLLGMDDAHPGNWLHYQDNAISIDHAEKSRLFSTGTIASNRTFLMAPFISYTKVQKQMADMATFLPPETIAFLKGLTKSDIHGYAQKSGLKITDKQVEGIMKRRDQVCAYVKN